MGCLVFQIRRIYDPIGPDDGQRWLVERLWPRGTRKEALAGAGWRKDVAPSQDLRKWYAHDASRWVEFQRRYRAELDANPSAWAPLLEAGRQGVVTLLYSAHDTEHNSALVLRDYLAERAGR